MNLKELSELLNLSQTTVSRALNGYPEVRDETRRRVVEAAERHNYMPNTRAKGLATGRSMSIGHVIPLSKKHEILNPIFGDFITGASEAYVAAGYDLVLSLVPDDDQAAHYRSLGAKNNVDGLILHGPMVNDSRIPLLQDLDLPFLVHGRASGWPEDYAYFDMNNRRAFERATRHLIELGHRRIAFVNGREEMDFAHRRRLGYEAALAASAIEPDPWLMVSGDMTESLGAESVARMLDAPDPPTAVLASSIVIALGVERAARARGLTVGRDLSIITHDDELSYLPNGRDEPLFTATRSSVREAGRRCAEILLGRVANPGGPPPQELVEADLILGRSTGPAPRKDSA
ncbi:LacI family DNA-binding transcriptional regulator [Roseivivax sp.]